MKLTVVGAGYVGLVTAAVFADLGNRVIVVDVDDDKIKKLKRGEIPFYEPGLEKLILKNVSSERLSFTKNYPKAILEAEIVFICVGTPTKNGKVDLSYVFSAVKTVSQNLKKPSIIVVKSTVPPGTNKKIKTLMAKNTSVQFEIASVPEFLKEGKALEDTMKPNRVIIGADSRKVAQKLQLLHKKIPGKRLFCSPESAQMIKYASNAFLPMKITFANSMAILCEKFGADIKDVVKGLGMDKRIGSQFVDAGLGYGGSCFPKDVAALIALAKQAGFDFNLMKAVSDTNKKMINHFTKKAVSLCGGTLKDKTVVVLGLAFKPGTSDMRESRSVDLIKKLQEEGAVVRACDPVAIPEAMKILPKIEYFADPYQALKEADCLVVGSGPFAWEEYRKLDFAKLKQIMRGKVIIDSWNVYNKTKLQKLGFIYGGIGR